MQQLHPEQSWKQLLHRERRAQQLADEKQEAKEARKRANAQFAKTQQLEDAMQAAKDAEREAITKRREQAEARKLAKEAESDGRP